MGQSMPYIMGGSQTALGIGAMMLGQPELAAPLMMSGIGTLAGAGIGQAAGGKKGEDIGSGLGGLVGGLGSGIGGLGSSLTSGLSSALGGLGGTGAESTPGILSSLFGSAQNATNLANAGAFGVNAAGQNLSGSGPLSWLTHLFSGGGSSSPASLGNVIAPGTGGTNAADLTSALQATGITGTTPTGVSSAVSPEPSSSPSKLSQFGSALNTASPYANMASNLLKSSQQRQPMQPPTIPSRSGAATQMQAPQPPSSQGPTAVGAQSGGQNQMQQLQQVMQMLSLLTGQGGFSGGQSLS